MNQYTTSNSQHYELNNSTLNSMEHMSPFDIGILVIFCIIAVLGSIGNLCILASIINNCTLRRVTHILIMNQALSDFLLSAVSVPLRILRICVKKSIFHSTILSSDIYCRTISGVNAAVLGTSLFGLLLLTVDKFLAVKRPLAYRTRMRTMHMSIPIAASWLLPLTFGLCGAFIPALQANLHDHDHDVACIISSTLNKVYALSAYVLMQILPLITMCPLYMYIIIKVKKSWRLPSRITTATACTPATNRRNVLAESHRRKELRLTKAILLILGVHIFCLTPIVALDIMHIVLHDNIPHTLDEIFLIFLHLNAVLDPLIYTRQSQDIQSTMYRVLGHFCPCRCRIAVMTLGNKRRTRAASRGAQGKLHQMVIVNSSSKTLRVEGCQDLSHLQRSESNEACGQSTTISSL